MNQDALDHLECSPSDFMYSPSQRTLICGECDFSFTRSLLQKRGSGANLCSTSFYDHDTEWLGRIQSKIGSRAFMIYLENLEFVKSRCRVRFGIDATKLRYHSIGNKLWNHRKRKKKRN